MKDAFKNVGVYNRNTFLPIVLPIDLFMFWLFSSNVSIKV